MESQTKRLQSCQPRHSRIKVYMGLLGIVLAILASTGEWTLRAETLRQTSTDLSSQEAKVMESYGQLPLSFEINQGQTDCQVKFLSRGSGYSLFLTSTEAVMTLRKPTVGTVRSQPGPARIRGEADGPPAFQHDVLRIRLVGANPRPQVTGMEELPGKANYFIGNDPEQWHSNVPTFAKVRYQDVYPGVDLVY